MKSKIQGLTIVELLITFVIMGILVSIAVPNYRDMIQNRRAQTLSTEFVTDLAYARNEAISRGQPVTLCPAADANLNACGNNGSWSNGWIIFVDPNSDGVIAANTDRLAVQEQLEPGTNFATNQARVTFGGTGFALAGAGTFTLSAAGCVGNNARTITISNTGRARVAEAAC